MTDSGIINYVSSRSISPRSIRRFEQASDVLAPDDNSVGHGSFVRSFHPIDKNLGSSPLLFQNDVHHLYVHSDLFQSRKFVCVISSIASTLFGQNLVILLGHKMVDLLHIVAGSRNSFSCIKLGIYNLHLVHTTLLI